MHEPGAVVGPDPGTAQRIELASDEVRVGIEPVHGGRIVSLVDRRSGREWLVQASDADDGAIGSWAAHDAVFTGERAYGWDECLPTVAPCADPLEPSGPPLRDHGDGWGRPVEVEPRPGADGGPASLRMTWEVAGRYRFERVVTLDGPAVRTDYRMIALGRDVPFLWSIHPLLALEPGARLAIPGVDAVRVTNGPGLDLRAANGQVAWPVVDTLAGDRLDLSRIPDSSAGTARKLYAVAAAVDGPAIAWQPDGAGLAFDWDREVAPALGIWIDAGGWPVGAGRQQVALEPTTAPFDDLATAMAHDQAAWARPGHDVRWWATIRLVVRDADAAPSSR